ncbi:MAG: hypothetical protein RI996_606 [Candidatus Parcubacteria bacterium]|jgi:hypothetical protein
MKKITTQIVLLLAILFLAVIAVGIYRFNYTNQDIYVENKGGGEAKQINTYDSTYIVDGQQVTLVNSFSEIPAAPGSASQIRTAYFGNDLSADFDGDGTQDIAFLITQETGGTGVFYYAVMKLNKASGTVGTNAVLLGDRIAPQSINMSDGALVVHFADRKEGEDFSVSPSVGKSMYLKLNSEGLLVVVPQTRTAQPTYTKQAVTFTEKDAKAIALKSCIKAGDTLGTGSYNSNSKTWWFDAQLSTTKAGCNPACVVDSVKKTAEINWRCTGLIVPPVVACTMDAKQCPDGSYVGRSGPNCQFVCPQ